MASSITRQLCRSLLANSSKTTPISLRLCSSITSHETSESGDASVEIDTNNEADAIPSSSPSSDSTNQREVYDRPLENGLDAGIYRAILVGQVGQTPVQKRLASGRTVTLLSVGTGGIRNNRRPFDNEDPKEYANRSAVQWHRVSIYTPTLGAIAMKHALPGSILYLEGNLETKIFTDPISGLVRRIREIAIRGRGRLVFLGKGDDAQQATQAELKKVGYY
ncbi:hypothetical protein NMG60_11024018 [Bertholletia excelsa]